MFNYVSLCLKQNADASADFDANWMLSVLFLPMWYETWGFYWSNVDEVKWIVIQNSEKAQFGTHILAFSPNPNHLIRNEWKNNAHRDAFHLLLGE